MSKAKAPDWMVERVISSARYVDTNAHWLTNGQARIVADAICQAIQDNPPRPTDEETYALINRTLGFPKDYVPNPDFKWGFNLGVRWANESLFRSEPEVPEEELKGMERAAALFDGLNFGPYFHPAEKIRLHINELRGKASK